MSLSFPTFLAAELSAGCGDSVAPCSVALRHFSGYGLGADEEAVYLFVYPDSLLSPASALFAAELCAECAGGIAPRSVALRHFPGHELGGDLRR